MYLSLVGDNIDDLRHNIAVILRGDGQATAILDDIFDTCKSTQLGHRIGGLHGLQFNDAPSIGLLKVLRRIYCDKFAMVNNRQAITESLRLFQVVGGD